MEANTQKQRWCHRHMNRRTQDSKAATSPPLAVPRDLHRLPSPRRNWLQSDRRRGWPVSADSAPIAVQYCKFKQLALFDNGAVYGLPHSHKKYANNEMTLNTFVCRATIFSTPT